MVHHENDPNHHVGLVSWNQVQSMRSHYGHWHSLRMPDSPFSAQHRHIKNRAMQWHFLVLPLCHYIVKIANNLAWGATFDNQMFDFGRVDHSIFSVMKKRAERCGSKMNESEVGVNQKFVPYT